MFPLRRLLSNLTADRGSHRETNARGPGQERRRDGAVGRTCSPDEEEQVGKIDQRPISTGVTEGNDATITIWSGRIPQAVAAGDAGRYERFRPEQARDGLVALTCRRSRTGDQRPDGGFG
jgi:hypothetical protein